MKDFFKDLSVIELAGVLAGPSVGLFFAELGARVVKVENPKTGGDVTRSWKLTSEDAQGDASAYYWSVNVGKDVLFLNLADPKDLETLHAMVKTADVVIANYKLHDDTKLHADYDTLKQINPQLIYAAVNGFGTGSPRTAYDLILQAESGFMYMNGEQGSLPVKMPVALIDILAGHQLKEGILLALLKRSREGIGSRVSVSLFDAAVASLANQATNWLIAHHLPTAQGSLHPNIAPYGELFTTLDRQLITFAIGSDKQFVSLCRLLKLYGMESDRRFATNQQRVANRQDLAHLMSEAVSGFYFDSLYSQCLQHDIPIGKVRNLEEVFELPEAKAMLNSFSYRGQALQSVRSVAFKIED